MPAANDSSFIRTLCFGEIAEDLIFPFPVMKTEERETLGQLRDSFATWLKGRDGEFRKWDQKGEMPPEAPGWFSTTTGWPNFSERRWAIMRPSTSVPPPGANGTTILMARFG